MQAYHEWSSSTARYFGASAVLGITLGVVARGAAVRGSGGASVPCGLVPYRRHLGQQRFRSDILFM